MRFSTELRIRFDYLKENLTKIGSMHSLDGIIFMVKANAYGHGLIPITEFAYANCGIKNFGVASLGEAIEIRRLLPQILARIFVFGDTNILEKDKHAYYSEMNILPVLASINEVEIVLNSPELKKMPLVLFFETGMHRLGITVDEIPELAQLLKKYARNEVQHVMSHFLSSYLWAKEGDKTNLQLSRFENILKELSSQAIIVKEQSIANSGAIEQKLGLKYTHIRPGLMAYGPFSCVPTVHQKAAWDGKIISSLVSRVIFKAHYKKGTPVGYGGTVCPADGTIIYLPIGYGDGFLTYYKNIEWKIGKSVGKILGRVNMDLIAIFFNESAPELKIGDEFRLWDFEQNSVLAFSEKAETIPYQIFTAITTRIPRRYEMREGK